MAKIAYKGKNSNLIAYKGDHEPIKVAVGGSVVENLSFKEKLVDGTSSVSYSSEYKKNLLEMQIHGRTRQTLLPLEYHQVEYIQSDGYCYIDTGVVPTDDTSVDITFSSESISGSHYIFGTRYSNANATVTFSVGASASNDYWAVYISGTPYLSTFKRVSSQKINVVIGKFDNGRKITFKNLKTGVESQVSTEAVYTVTNLSAWLFGYNGMGQSISPKAQKIKIYSCKIYEKDILVRNFIPCYRNSDGVIGMYDTTNGVFYTRGGTGTFLKGDEYYFEPSIDYPQEIKNVGDNGLEVELRGKNLVNYLTGKYIKVENEYYSRSAIGFVLEPNTTYTVSFDYEFISKDTNVFGWSIGRGKTYYAKDLVAAIDFPNLSKGRAYRTFTTPSSLGDEDILCLGWARADARFNCEMYVRNLMVTYGRDLSTYEPYAEPQAITLNQKLCSLEYINNLEGINPIKFNKDRLVVNWKDKTSKVEKNILCEKVADLIDSYGATIEKVQDTNTYFLRNIPKTQQPMVTKPICSHFSLYQSSDDTGFDIYNGGDSGNCLFANVAQSTVEEFEAWLRENNVTIAYQLETSIVSDVSMGLLDLNDYTQNQTNIIEIESELEPSGLNVTYAKWEV